MIPPRARGRGVAADLEILLDRHRRKEAATFGDERDPVAAELVRRDRREISPVEAHAAAADRQQAGDRVDERGLAGAVRSHHGDELARAYDERHVPDGDGVAVSDLEPFDLKHRPSRGRRGPRPDHA
jgi:hypothetical protein